MTMQKSKGKSYESKIAKYIHNSLYEKCSEYKQLFDTCQNDNLKPKRDSSSGTFKNSDNDIDLGLAKKFFPFSVECKHHARINDININALLSGKNAWFETTFKQASEHSNISNLTPIIIFRGNRTIDMICMKRRDLPCYSINVKDNFIVIGDMIVIPLEDFMNSYCLRFSF